MQFRCLPIALLGRQMGPAPRVFALLLALAAMLFALSARGEQTTIAVASNFAAPMKRIVTEFEQRSGHRVVLAFGSSGKFFAQIHHGAPFDAFFSADQTKPARLVADGLADGRSRFTYAEGRLVLWSRSHQLVDGEGTVLKTGRFNRLAIANPKLAPYGAAAVEVLQNLELEKATRTRWVQGENIAQAYQFVATGNADLGLVALSQVVRDGEISSGSAWVVPANLYRPIRQDAVILKRARDNPALTAFWSFIRKPEMQAIIESFGYANASGRKCSDGESSC